MKTNYSMLIQWSEIDQIFVVTIPEFEGRVMMPCTHGDTHEEAARHGLEVIETFLAIWTKEGKPIPEHQALIEEPLDQATIEWLRKEIALGMKDFEEGRFETYTDETLDELFEKIMTEGRAELQKLELDRRKAEYEANPTPLLSWEEVQASILKKYA